MPKDKDTSSPLLQCDDLVWLNIQSCAETVEAVCGGALIDPPQGVYRPGRLEPAMLHGRNYFIKDGMTTVQISELKGVDKSIYDESGTCVIPAVYLKTENKLSNAPFYPYRGLHIVADLVRWQQEQHAAYRKSSGKTYVDAFAKHCKSDVDLENELSQAIHDATEPVREQVRKFLADHIWSLFFVKLHNEQLRIERGIDWRAYEWEKRHGEDWRAGKYR